MVALITLPLAAMLWVLNRIERSQHLAFGDRGVRGTTRGAATPSELPFPPKTRVPGTAEPEPTRSPAEVPITVFVRYLASDQTLQ